MAIKVQNDKNNRSKKNKFKKAIKTVMAATRRKKQPTEILREPIKPGTLLTDARKRTIVNLINEKPPVNPVNQFL